MTESEKMRALLDAAFTEVAEGQCWVAANCILVAADEGGYWTVPRGDLSLGERSERFDPLHSLNDAWVILDAAFPGAPVLLDIIPPFCFCTIIADPDGSAAQAMATTPCEAVCQVVVLAVAKRRAVQNMGEDSEG